MPEKKKTQSEQKATQPEQDATQTEDVNAGEGITAGSIVRGREVPEWLREADLKQGRGAKRSLQEKLEIRRAKTHRSA
jgi:hypothetical protein